MLQNLCLVLTSLFMKYPISLLFHEDGAIWILCIWSQGGGFIAIHLSSLWVHLYVFSTWSGKKVKNFCMLFGSRITWPKAYFFLYIYMRKDNMVLTPFYKSCRKYQVPVFRVFPGLSAVRREVEGGDDGWICPQSPVSLLCMCVGLNVDCVLWFIAL